MGVNMLCKKSEREIIMGYGGYGRLRAKVAQLHNADFGTHYSKLNTAEAMFSVGEAREKFFAAYNETTQAMVSEKKVNPKIVNFCHQPDCDGMIRYGACAAILAAIGDYDDDIIYGYSGRENPTMFKDFKALLQECVELKSDLFWH